MSIRGSDYGNFFAGVTDGDEFHFEISWSQELGCASIGGDGIEMCPSVALPRKDKEIASVGPKELVIGNDFVEDAAAAWLGAPNFVRFSGGRVGDIDRPGSAFALEGRGICRRSARRNGASTLY